MPANFRRQRVCNACAESKRRCDKRLPECQRCIDRDVDCVYPPRKRRRQDAPDEAEMKNTPYNTADTVEIIDHSFGLLQPPEWDAVGSLDFGLGLSDVMVPFDHPESLPTLSDGSIQSLGLETFSSAESTNSTDSVSPWFLQDESWTIYQRLHQPDGGPPIDLEAIVHLVEEMFQSWIRTGCNGFIHPRLYDNGMPECLQDAFTALTTYLNRTQAVKDTVMHIIETRLSKLVRLAPPTEGGADGVLAHLARVQALCVYMFIQLFDGSVTQRVSAEKYVPILREWGFEMWEAVKRYAASENAPLLPACQVGQGGSVASFDDPPTELWRSWILTESARRTHVIVDNVHNVYQMMTQGWTECTGGVMFTARKGLWQAESAVKWFDLCCAGSPLLVPSLQPEPLISQYAAEDFDDFAKVLWKFLIGPDKMQCWIDRGNKVRG